MELPTDLYTIQEVHRKRELSSLTSAVHVKEGGMVYDCTWYPFMNSTEPATCWLVTIYSIIRYTKLKILYNILLLTKLVSYTSARTNTNVGRLHRRIAMFLSRL